MTREEQLKQAIEEAAIASRKTYLYKGLEYYYLKEGLKLASQDPSILRHADPEIMKQAGWVREEDWIPKIERILLLCENNGKPVDGFAFRETILELRKQLTNNNP